MTVVSCQCCWFGTVNPSVSDSSRICPDCRAHLHSLENLRRDHKNLVGTFQTQYESEIERKQAAIEKQEATIGRLQAELAEALKIAGADLADAPEHVLKPISTAAISELQDRERKAYRIRDRAMAAVWTIDERHHAVTGDKCSCGLALNGCKDYRGLSFFRAEYERWERKQIELMKADKQHGLPSNHPEAQKLNVPGWRWHGAPPTETDQRSPRLGL